MEQTISIGSVRNILSVRSFRSVRRKCSFPFDNIVVPNTALLYPVYKYNCQMAVAWVGFCATGMYRSIGLVEFSEISNRNFRHGKAAINSYSYSTLTCLSG